MSRDISHLKSSGYFASSYVNEVCDNMKKEEEAEKVRKTFSNCFGCDQAERKNITLTGDQIPFHDPNQVVSVLHDVQFPCKYQLDHANMNNTWLCTKGNKVGAEVRCSQCKFAIPHNVIKNTTEKMIVKITIYECTCPEKEHLPGEFYRSYCLCEYYDKKEE